MQLPCHSVHSMHLAFITLVAVFLLNCHHFLGPTSTTTMPPRKLLKRKHHRWADAKADPLSSLPPDVLEIVLDELLIQDKLNNVLTSARDIAALAMTCRSLYQLANSTLWQLLGQDYSAEGASSSSSGMSCVPKAERYEVEHLSTKVRKVATMPTMKALTKTYEQEVSQAVPPHIYHECVRLSCLGTAGSNAKKEFNLTDGDLKDVPCLEKSRGAMGTAHVYSLANLLKAARAKHGSAEGMAAKGRAKAARAEQRKRGVQDALARRRQALQEALAPLGTKLSKTMEGVEVVKRYLKGGKGAPKLEDILHYLQLVDWCTKHTHYMEIRSRVLQSEDRWMMFKVHYRQKMQGRGYYGGNYFAAADNAAASLSQDEEDDCMRLACQEWAEQYGGVQAAMGRPEVPQAGPLRESILKTIGEKVRTNVQHDAGYMDDDNMSDYADCYADDYTDDYLGEEEQEWLGC